jgi:hypothetical protein
VFYYPFRFVRSLVLAFRFAFPTAIFPVALWIAATDDENDHSDEAGARSWQRNRRRDRAMAGLMAVASAGMLLTVPISVLVRLVF